MKLPIDTTSMTFLCASAPEPVLDFDTRQQKEDENGKPLYALQVVVLTEGAAEVISVKTPGKPQVQAGETLAMRSLIATPWAIGDRSGVAYRARQVESAGTPASRSAKA